MPRFVHRDRPLTVQDTNRALILEEVNKVRLRHNTPPLRARHLQQAVFACVQLRLVEPETLRAAGFRGAADRLARQTGAARGGALRRYAHARARRQYERAVGQRVRRPRRARLSRVRHLAHRAAS